MSGLIASSSEEDDDGVLVPTPLNIDELIHTDLVRLNEIVRAGYVLSKEELDKLVSAFNQVTAPPQISPLDNAGILVVDYETRVQSIKAKHFYNLFAHATTNLDLETTNYFLQRYFNELITLSTFSGENLSAFVAPNKVNASSFDFLVLQAFNLFRQYNSLRDTLKSDKTLTFINHLIDMFLLPSPHLLTKSAQQLGADLLAWLKLMAKAPNELLSRSGGTATKVAAICYKLATKADLSYQDADGTNILLALMQSKLPNEEATKLTTFFMEQGAICHKESAPNHSALRFAMCDLSFGQGIVQLMFEAGKIPTPELRNMLQQAKTENNIYTPYIITIVKELAKKKILANTEIQQLISWIVHNSTANNPTHPSYAWRKELYLLINLLLADQHWSNHGLLEERKSLWEQLSPLESAKQVSQLDSITGVLNYFNSNPEIEFQEILEALASFIFTTKHRVRDDLIAVQLLEFIQRCPMYIPAIVNAFNIQSDSSADQPKRSLLHSSLTRINGNDNVLVQAAANLNAEFIKFVLTIVNAIEDPSLLILGMVEAFEKLALQLNQADPDICQNFFEIKTYLNENLAHAMLKVATIPTVSIPYLELLLKINHRFPLPTQLATAELEGAFTIRINSIIDQLSTYDVVQLSHVRSLMYSLNDFTLVEEFADFIGNTSFEITLYRNMKESIVAKHGNNKFILNSLDLMPQISAKVVPNSTLENEEQEEVIVDKAANDTLATDKPKFLGFMFGKAKQIWSNIVDAPPDPVLARLLSDHQPEENRSSSPTPMKN